jgi:flagellar biosynthesis/type III secretory pathway protein FliH
MSKEPENNLPEQGWNSFIEKIIKAANEHQAGGYEWQEEKRKSFAKGASFGYSLAQQEIKTLKDCIQVMTESFVVKQNEFKVEVERLKAKLVLKTDEAEYYKNKFQDLNSSF